MKIKFNLSMLLVCLSIFAGAAAAGLSGTPAAARTVVHATAAPTPSATPAPPASADQPLNVAGKWKLVADAGSQTIDIDVELKQTGADVTGSTSSQMGAGVIDGGKVKGKTLSAILHADIQGQPVDFAMEGTVDGDKMTGSFSNANFGSVPFSAVRSK